MTSLSRSVLCRAAANTVIARHCAYALAVASAMGLATQARAVNDAYSLDAASGLFSNSFTLNTTVPVAGGTASPATGDALYFGGVTTGTTAVSNDLTGFTFVGLVFNLGAASFTIGGNDFSLGGPITNSSYSRQTINNNFALTANSTITTGNNGSSLTLGGVITGASALTFAGTGQVILSGNNAGYSGATVISGANNTVRLSNANALGTGAINMAAGSGVIELTNNINFGGNVTALVGRTTSFLRNVSGNNTYSGTVTQTATGGGTAFESAGGFLSVSGTVTSTQLTRVLYLQGASNGAFTAASTINTNFNQIIKQGGGTWTLSGNAVSLLSGATIVSGGTLAVDATTGVFGTAGALTLNGNGATFSYLGNAAGGTQTLGALTISGGRTVIQSTYGGGGTTGLNFASLGTRGAGSTANFIATGGTAGTVGVAGNNNFVFTTAPANLVDPGIFYNGSNYAFYDTTGNYLRGVVYGTDANTSTTGATTSVTGTNVQITGDVSTQATTTLATLNLSGNRNLTLDTAATLTVNGLLKTGNAAGTATISGGAGIQAGTGAELVVRTDAANDTLTISTPVLANGANALTKTGLGTLTLSGANTYTGATNVLQGTVNLTNTNAGAGATNVTEGTLSFTGAGALTGSTTTGTLTLNPTAGTLATMNVNTTGTLLFGLGANVGAANANNVAILNLQAGTLVTGGAATQRDYVTGNTGFGTTNMTGGTLSVGGFLTTGFNAAGSIGIFNLSGGTVATNFTGGATVNFGGTLGASVNTIGQLNVTGGALTLNSPNTLGGIFVGEQGLGNLNVSGTGVATFGGSATSAGLTIGGNTGAAVVGAGVVNLGAVGTGGGTIITNTVRRGGLLTTTQGTLNFHGGTLQSSATPAAAFFTGLTSAYVFGEGGTINNNAQNITVGQALLAPTGSGITAVAVSAGGTGYATAPLVVISGGGGTGATAVATVNGSGVLTGITITNPGTGYTSQPTIQLLGGSLSGTTLATPGTATLAANTSGGLAFSGTGTTILTGANTYTGTTTIGTGTTLQLGAAGTAGSLAATSAVANSGTLSFNRTDAVTVANVVSGAGALTQVGTGNTILTGANTYTGATTISAGTLTLGAGGTTGSLSPTSVITDNGTFAVNRSNAAVQGTDFSTAAITGTGGVTVQGTGTVTFNVANPYTGPTNIGVSGAGTRIGTIIAAANGALGTGLVTVGVGGNDATATLRLTNSITLGNAINLPGRTLATGVGIQNVSGNNTLSGAVTFDVGGTQYVYQSDAGTLAFTNAAAGTLVAGKTLTLQGAGNGSITGVLAGAGTVAKAGAGTWTLSGANTYSGGTAVNGGILSVTANGALGAGNATVATTATSLTIGTGVNAPFNGNTFILTLAGGGAVGIADVGFLNLTSGANITVSGLVLGATTEPAGTYTAANFPEYISGTGSVTVVPVPEPSTWVMLLGALGGFAGWSASRRQKA